MAEHKVQTWVGGGGCKVDLQCDTLILAEKMS